MQRHLTTDFLVIGAGIIGLGVARSLRRRFPGSSITLIEKESAPGMHASGRNSGVLHAGFYYTADSLKARFTREGNARMQAFCRTHGIAVNTCGKVVVARDANELETLFELQKRAQTNGVEAYLIDEDELRRIEPNARTFSRALYSPTTATVDPKAVVAALAKDVSNEGVKLVFGTGFLRRVSPHTVETNRGTIDAGVVINCAGLYADRVARAFGFGRDYTIVPFKGIYLTYDGDVPPVRTNVYPVPKLSNPFLGVHYTVTADGTVKIGPTAIPAFWRENYRGFSRFNAAETAEILRWEAELFLKNRFSFRTLAFEEFRKYDKSYLQSLARGMVRNADVSYFRTWSTPGIRAQLLHRRTLELVQDFIVEGDADSVHVLNAVSPAFTCSFPFADWIVERYLSS